MKHKPLWLGLLPVLGLGQAFAQRDTLLQEGFNDDGAGKRYKVEGTFVSEEKDHATKGVQADQTGPVYWNLSSKVSFVGVPAATPARRAVVAWHHELDNTMVSPDALALMDATIAWLLNGKAAAKVIFSPAPAGPGDDLIVDLLKKKGHTVSDDDPAAALPAEASVDLVIHTSSGSAPSRFTKFAKPVLTYNAPDHDDELLTTIGATEDSDTTKATIKTASHPGAAGKTGSVNYLIAPGKLDMPGRDIPPDAIVIANLPAQGDLPERPAIVLINGPEGKGSFYGGGPFAGFEGSGFFGGAALNKFPAADFPDPTVEPRFVELNPVSVAGKKNVKITAAFAASFLDFETSDFMRLEIDPGTGTWAELVNFTPPDANVKFFADSKGSRLGLTFKDFTYDVPTSATNLKIRVSSSTTWWNEIVAFDNIRVTADSTGPFVPKSSAELGSQLVADTPIFKGTEGNLDNWEPNASVLGEDVFLIEANRFADKSTENQNFGVAFQKVSGGAAVESWGFFGDDGKPFSGQINLSRQNGNPGRVAGDKRPGATTYMVGGEASPHAVAAFGSNNRWKLGFNRLDDGRYGTVQLFTLDSSLTPKPASFAFDGVNSQAAKGEPPSNQITRFGGEIAALDNGNFVIVVADKSTVTSATDPSTTATIVSPTGAIVTKSFTVTDTDIWSNLAAFKGGFAVRAGGSFYFYDNAGKQQGDALPQDDAELGFDKGRGDGTRIASHINSSVVYLAGKVDAAVHVAAFDATTRKFLASAQVNDFEAEFDRVNLAVDALNRVAVAYEAKPGEPSFALHQIAVRVLSFDAAGKKFTPLGSSMFAFKNTAVPSKSDSIRTIRPSVAMTTKAILVAGKGEINLANDPNKEADSPSQTTIYTVIKHPDPKDDPTPKAVITGGSPLVAQYKFDGDAKDSSGNGLDGTVTGATFSDDVPPGFTGKSISFKSNADVVQVAHNAKLDITNAITISAWVKPVGNVAWDGILAKSPSDGSGANHAGNYELRIENGARKPNFLYQRGAKDDTNTGLLSPGAATVPEGVWSHLAFTAVKGGDGIYYLNGVEISKIAIEATFGVPNTNPLYIGTRADKFTNMDGLIDQVELYNVALSAAEIKKLATPPAPAVDPSLLVHLTFDGNVNDASGKGRNGTVLNGATFSNDVPAALGKGQSLELKNGGGTENQGVNIPAHDSLGANVFTLAYFIKPTTEQGNAGLERLTSRAGDAFETAVGDGNAVGGKTGMQLSYFQGGWQLTNVAISQGQWTHVAWSNKGAGAKDMELYVNGALAFSGPGLPATRPGTGFMNIGTRHNTVEGFEGFIDDFRLYGKNLTAAEIKTLAGNTGSGGGTGGSARPSLISQTRYAAGAFGITLQTTAGAKYDLEYSQDLKTWTVINADVPGTGQPLLPNETDAARKARAQGFYRVRVK